MIQHQSGCFYEDSFRWDEHSINRCMCVCVYTQEIEPRVLGMPGKCSITDIYPSRPSHQLYSVHCVWAAANQKKLRKHKGWGTLGSGSWGSHSHGAFSYSAAGGRHHGMTQSFQWPNFYVSLLISPSTHRHEAWRTQVTTRNTIPIYNMAVSLWDVFQNRQGWPVTGSWSSLPPLASSLWADEKC